MIDETLHPQEEAAEQETGDLSKSPPVPARDVFRDPETGRWWFVCGCCGRLNPLPDPGVHAVWVAEEPPP